MPSPAVGTMAASVSRAQGLGLPGVPGGTTVLNATSNSGFIVSSVSGGGGPTIGQVYTDARSGPPGTVNIPVLTTSVGSSLQVGQNASTDFVDGGFYAQVTQAFIEFDTALAVDAMSVFSATLRLYFITDNSTQDFDISVAARNYGTSLTDSDYVPGDSLPSTSFIYIPTSTITYNTTSTVQVTPLVNPSGKTQLLIYSSGTQSNSTPADGVDESVTIALGFCTLTLMVDY